MSSIFSADLLLIGQNEGSVLSIRNSLGGLNVNYELWTIESNGALTGSKVFEYCDDNKVIIRIIGENDTFTDAESMILEDYLSALGALIIFAGKKDNDFYKFPLVKDYILAMKDKIAYIRPGDMLKPLNEKVFGTKQLKLTEGPLQTTRMLPDAEGVVTNAFTITGQEDSYVSLLVSSCTFRLSFFSFHPDRIQIPVDRDYLIKKCMDYVNISPKKRAFEGRAIRIPETGTIIKDFEMNDLNGVAQSLGKYVGNKGVILSYWAAWCSTCNDEMPVLQKYFFEDGPYQILGANFKESVETIQNFKEQHGITFPLIPDPEGKIRKLYRIPTVPILFFIDRAGVLRYVYRGMITEEDLQKWIEVISEPVSDESDINEELFLNKIINFDKNGLKKFIK